jgi:hypothetical protein
MKIFKYRSDNKYTENMLSNAEIYMNAPKEFNDPFDCRSRSIYQGSFEEWKYFFMRYGEQNDKAEQMARFHELNPIQEDNINDLELDQNFNRVCCFAENESSILMWSHYANNHKGICFIYEAREEEGNIFLELEENQLKINHPLLDKYLPLLKVKYSEEMPKPFNRLKDDVTDLVNFFLTKHIDWSYEKERRVLLLEPYLKNNPLNIKRNNIIGLIFGMRTDDHIIDKYKNIAKIHYIDKGLNFEFYKCEHVKGFYKIKLKSL